MASKKIKTRSGLEERIVGELTRARCKFEYESIKLDYILVKKYTPDIILNNGIVVELKGYFRPADRAKFLAVIKQNPDKDIRIVFEDHEKTISKRSKTTYSMWCEKHGIKWAQGNIPKAWIKERKKT